MDRSKFKVPEPEVKKSRPIKGDASSGISVAKNKTEETAKLNVNTVSLSDVIADDPVVEQYNKFDLSGRATEEQTYEEPFFKEETIPFDEPITPTESEPRAAVKLDFTPPGDGNGTIFKKYTKVVASWPNNAIGFMARKPRKTLVISGIVLGVVVVGTVVLLQTTGKDSNDLSNADGLPTSVYANNAVSSANFIVFGPGKDAPYVANRSDYSLDPSTGALSVEARSASDNSKRIAISEQKVPSNFEDDPYGLKNLLVSIGPTFKLSTNVGTSYIVEAHTTGLAVRGGTLIFIRTTTMLTPEEWIKVFESLQPTVISELGL